MRDRDESAMRKITSWHDLPIAMIKYPRLDLLVLFGSRARDDARPGSDWDFGYLAAGCSGAAPVDLLGIQADLALHLGDDAVDLVDLHRAGGLLRYRVARDGVLIFERTPGILASFSERATRFWLDAEAILRPAYDAVLDGLDP